MLKKNFNYLTMSATRLFFCVLGFSFIFDPLAVRNWLYTALVIGISVVGVIRIFNMILNHRKLKHRGGQFLDIIVWLTVIIISPAIPEIFFAISLRLIGCWTPLYAIIKIIVFYIKIKDRLSIPLMEVISLCGDLIIAFLLIVNSGAYEDVTSFSLGAYFLIYGGNTLFDLTREILSSGSGDKLDQKTQPLVPPVLSAAVPPHLMSTLLNKDREDEIKERFDAIKEGILVDMEVLIYLAPSGPAMFGYADAVYRGLVIFHGCHDPHGRHLFGTLGDGAVIIAPKDTYIRNCLENEDKTLIGFGISLNEEQKKGLNDRILEVFETFCDPECDEQLKQKGFPCGGVCDDYLSRVTRTSPEARFYKIREGELRTSSVVSSNCVFLLGNLPSSVGLDLFDLSGIISPGAHCDLLNKQFKSHKGFTVSRRLYRKKDANQFDQNTSEFHK